MVSEEIFEEIGFWPKKLYIPTMAGYSIWAHIEDGPDLLLAVDNNLLLFNTSKALSKFLVNNISCNLSNLPNYGKLKEHFKTETLSSAFLRPYVLYDFNSMKPELTQVSWSTWDKELSHRILNSFNMIFDIANTIGDDWIINSMSKQTNVCTFLDILTYLTESDLPSLDTFDKKEIVDFYDESLKRISARTLLICK